MGEGLNVAQLFPVGLPTAALAATILQPGPTLHGTDFALPRSQGRGLSRQEHGQPATLEKRQLQARRNVQLRQQGVQPP